MINQQKIKHAPHKVLHSFATGFLVVTMAAITTMAGIATAQPAGNIQFVSGIVEIERGAEKIVAARATLVNVGDLIRTSADGNIHLNMIDGAFLSLRPGSEMRIEKYEFNQTQTSIGDAVIGLIKGTMRTFTGEIVSRNRDAFKMRTAVASLGIRGSGNVLAHYDAIGTINHTLTGAHVVTSNAGGTLVSLAGQTIQVLPGQAPRYIPTPAFIAQAASPPPKSAGGGEPEKAAEPAVTATTSSTTGATPPPATTPSASQANTSAVAAVLAATKTVTGGVVTLRGVGSPVSSGYQGLFMQTNAAGNTSAVLNAAGQLIEIRNADISANIYGNATFPSGYLPFGSSNATGIFSGGNHADGFTTADGSVTIGRWSGGSLTLLNNNLPTTDANYRTVLQLGGQSTSYGLVTPTLGSVTSAFTGTASYALLAATAPVDARGNVGSLSSATVGINFSLLTARLNAALAINNQNLTLTGNSAFARGSNLLQWTSGLGSLSIACSGANCSASGYDGSVAASIAGAAGSFMGGQYRINPTRTAGGFLTDLINGHFVLQTTTTPAVGSTLSDPNLQVLMRASNPLPTGGYEGLFPQGGTAILNAAGHFIGATNANYAAFISTSGVGGVIPAGYVGLTIANASYEFLGGQHQDAFRTSDGSVILGRWQGGTFEVRDSGQSGAAATIYNLGPRSAAYGLIQTTSASVLGTFTGSSTYSLIGSTRPTDGAGNVGTLNAWTVGVNFNTLTATLNGSLSINNQNLTVTGQAVPFQQGSFNPAWVALNPSNPNIASASTMVISCTGSNCSSRGYVGVTNTSIAGANGQFAAGQFRISSTGVPGSGGAMPDHITAFYALQAASAPTAGNVLPQTGTAALSFGTLSNAAFGNHPSGGQWTASAVSGTLNANFATRTVGFNATVATTLTQGGAGPTINASAANAPIVGVGFSAATGAPVTNVAPLTVTCSGACTGIQTTGRFDGFFLGTGGNSGRVFFTVDNIGGTAAFGVPGSPVAPTALIAQDAGRMVYATDIGTPGSTRVANTMTDLRRRNGPGVIN